MPVKVPRGVDIDLMSEACAVSGRKHPLSFTPVPSHLAVFCISKDHEKALVKAFLGIQMSYSGHSLHLKRDNHNANLSHPIP